MTDYILALSTTDSEEEARQIAKVLVAEKLVACVNIIPNLRSVYRWKDKICDEKELLLIIKTVKNNRENLKRKFQELHHYETPELIFFNIDDGLPKYLDWIKEITFTSL